MKKTNKGFSMVELIIVIAIMAILAGALAPALIKYINKSRLSTDIQTGQTIATAIQTALSNETAYDQAPDNSGTPSEFSAMMQTASASFKAEVTSVIDPAKAKAKAKKTMDGSSLVQQFLVEMDPVNNVINVYLKGNGNDKYAVYPTPDAALTE